MKKGRIFGGLSLLFFISCSLFQELLEPGDIAKMTEAPTDTVAPVVTILSPVNGQEVSGVYQFSGTVNDEFGSGIKAVFVKTDNGGYFSVPVTIGIWTTSISNLAMGYHTNYVYAEDNAGNKSPFLAVSVLRTSIPVVAFTSHIDGMLIEQSNIVVTGTVSIESPYHITNVKVRLNGGEWTNATGTNSWSIGLTLIEGTNTIQAAAFADNGKSNISGIITLEYGEWTTNKLTASDGAESDVFGNAVAVSADGNTIVVGARFDDDKGSDSGSVYRYKWNGTGWDEIKFIAYDGTINDWFGYAVAVSADGNVVVVGAIGDDDKGSTSGSVYRFTWNGSVWLTNKFIASDGTNSDKFGYSVSVSADGNAVFAGAIGDDDMGNNNGSVYRFQLYGTNWTTNKFTVPSDPAYAGFGVSLSTSPDGNMFASGANANFGAVFLFEWNGVSWVRNILTAYDGAAGDQFGISVSLSADGNTVVAGASEDDDLGDTSGSVYIFKWNGSAWNPEKLTAYDGAAFDYFGFSTAVSGDGNTVVVGVSEDDDRGLESGSVYVLKWNGSAWNTEKLTAYDGVSGDQFGISVAVSSDGKTLAFGANGDDSASGSVYLRKW
ncbi:MAG: hypothetical protein A2Y33_11830 [Spirochaetes bacterium GWF1_51_8]|nr:MAG: hypothetical protein A2Y33_11830 [Spirochaetes bacterium GWF1_51_8]